MRRETNPDLPFARCWWIDRSHVIGGRYPGTQDQAESLRMLAALLDAGVRTVINLQRVGELGAGGRPFRDYVPDLERLAGERGVEMRVHRFPVGDMDVPDDPSLMDRIVAAIDESVAAGHRVYVHCWGGHGRTGTVAGSWLVRRGLSCNEALDSIAAARNHDPHLRAYESPQTQAQRQFVRGWRSLNDCPSSG